MEPPQKFMISVTLEIQDKIFSYLKKKFRDTMYISNGSKTRNQWNDDTMHPNQIDKLTQYIGSCGFWNGNWEFLNFKQCIINRKFLRLREAWMTHIAGPQFFSSWFSYWLKSWIHSPSCHYFGFWDRLTPKVLLYCSFSHSYHIKWVHKVRKMITKISIHRVVIHLLTNILNFWLRRLGKVIYWNSAIVRLITINKLS